MPRTPVASRKDTAAGLLTVLGPLQRMLRKRAREDWPLEPLATAQVELLRAVRNRKGITVGEAAAVLRIAPNTASTPLANGLVAAGLVNRETDPHDRRSVRLVVTPAAERRMAAWNDRRQQVLDAALGRLEPGERAALEAAIGPLQADREPRIVLEPRTPAVSIRDLLVRFGDTTAVDAVDLEVGDGEVSDCSARTAPVRSKARRRSRRGGRDPRRPCTARFDEAADADRRRDGDGAAVQGGH